MQRRAQIGLSKGEAHHGLKNALRIGRQGEIRDRTADGQHYRMACLNLLARIFIFWNNDQLGKAVQKRQKAGLDCQPELLSHISPLGWAKIMIKQAYDSIPPPAGVGPLCALRSVPTIPLAHEIVCATINVTAEAQWVSAA